MTDAAPALDIVATVRARVGTEIRAVEAEIARLEECLVAARTSLAIRLAIRAAVNPPNDQPHAAALTIPRQRVK